MKKKTIESLETSPTNLNDLPPNVFVRARAVWVRADAKMQDDGIITY